MEGETLRHYEHIKKAFSQGYRVDKSGNVYGKNGKRMSPQVNNCGYYRLNLSVSGKKRRVAVHQVVFVWFKGYSNNINHKNGNKRDNRPGNLELSDGFKQMRHAHKKGLVAVRRGEAHNMAKLSVHKVEQIRNFCAEGLAQRLIAKKFKVSQATVSLINQHRIWRTK